MKTTNTTTHISEITYELPQGTRHRLSPRDGTFLFTAYGCALLERQTDSGMYVYTAANLKTGRSQILSRRKVKLDRDKFESIADKINTSSVCGTGRFYIDKKPNEQTDGKTISAVANHIFHEILPQHGYAVRERQIELTHHILDVARSRALTLAESEVGTGKTHAYLIAAVLAKRGRLNDCWMRGHYPNQSWAKSAHMPVILSTSSIALQKAIVTDYIPELSDILMRHGIIRTPLTAVVRKGKEHYVCRRRLHRYYNGADTQTRSLLMPFIGTGAPIDLTDADTLTPYMKRAICVTAKCGDSCRVSKGCRYQAHLKTAYDSTVDFQITNHNYFLADTVHRAQGKRPLLPNYQLVIIDEAHKFLQAARSIYGLELTNTELPDLVREIHAYSADKSGDGVNIHKLAKKLEEQNKKLFQRLHDNISELISDDEAERFPAVMEGDVLRHLKNIAGIAKDIDAASADSYVRPLYKERRTRALWRLGIAAECADGLRNHSDLICWLEKRVEGKSEITALCAIPKDLNKRLYRDLWSNGVPMVLTSGTLSASGDFTRAKKTLGLDRLPPYRLFDTSMPSPFDYKRNTLLYISETMPFPDNRDKRYIAAIADEVERLVTASHGHAAVLFTSYHVMGQVHALLQRRGLPFPLFRLERGGTHAIEQFKQSGSGILLASGALWEGIDIPGDALSLLIIVKLPFAVPDPIGEYERSLCRDMDEYKAQVIVPDMLVKLKQGFGRLVRKETDTGVVAILDSRTRADGSFRQRVLRALPECSVTASVEDVQDFMRTKKSTAYFSVQNSEGGIVR